jgi:hypothetical protein
MTPPQASKVSSRFSLGLAVLALGIVAVIVLHTPIAPPLGDYAEWTYHGILLRNLLSGHPDTAYLLKDYPVPNSLSTVGLGVLMLLLPWKLAAKMWLLCGLLFGLFAAWQLQRSNATPQGWRVLLFTAAALIGIPFWAGFTNFLLGTYLAMLFAALLLRGIASRWLYAVLMVVLFFCHFVPYSFALLLLVLYTVQYRKYQLLWQSVPSLLLSFGYIVGRLLHGNADSHAGMVSSIPYLSPLFPLFKINTYLKCWGFVNPAFADHDSLLLTRFGSSIFFLLFLLNFAVALLALWLLATTAWKSITTRRPSRFLWIAASLFALTALLMPGAALGISDPGSRMMQVALWTAICLVSVQRRWMNVVLMSCALCLLVADCAMLARFATQPPLLGSTAGPLPARVREFGHVYYGDRWGDYAAIDAGKMDLDIYPTAMFLKKEPAPRPR